MSTPGDVKRKVVGVVLRPLDVLFFRDGRPMQAGWQVTSGLPTPQVLAGAFRTWFLTRLGCNFERLAQSIRDAERGLSLEAAVRSAQMPEAAQVFRLRFRGPWLAKQEDDGTWSPLVPAPANLYRLVNEGGVGAGNGSVGRDKLGLAQPLTTTGLPGWRPVVAGLAPLWIRDRRPAERVGGFLTRAGLEQYLSGSVPDSAQVLESSVLCAFDRRTGIAIDPSARSTEEGRIYDAAYLALREGVGFYAEIEAPDDEASSLLESMSSGDLVNLGGDGKRVAVELVPPIPWPETALDKGDGVLLLLTTPLPADTMSAHGPWLPSVLAGRLVAAAVPGSRAISGWDLARGGPKPTRFLIEPGSVYFLGCDAADVPRSSLAEAEDANVGWGHFVKGVWKHV